MSDSAEAAALRKELKDLQEKRDQEISHYEAQLDKERTAGKAYNEQIEQKTGELASMRGKMARLTKQLDEEVMRRDHAQSEAQTLAGKVQDLSDGVVLPTAGTHTKGKGISFEKDKSGADDAFSSSTKLMRVVEHWMQHKDMQQALLRNAGINDMAFSTLSQVLVDCQSLQTLDLACNALTMDSCSELCNLITTSPQLSFVYLSENKMSLRSLGYFMTAIMERQNAKKIGTIGNVGSPWQRGLGGCSRRSTARGHSEAGHRSARPRQAATERCRAHRASHAVHVAVLGRDWASTSSKCRNCGGFVQQHGQKYAAEDGNRPGEDGATHRSK
jgi:hypothetical protein